MRLNMDIVKKAGAFTLRARLASEASVLSLLGPSGAGKSMTLRCLAGIDTPDDGYIELDGRVLFDRKKGVDLPPQKRRVGYLFQNNALFPHMTVLQNIMAGQAAPDRARALRLAQAMQVADCADKKPDALSGGQAQRAALARILASRAEVLLLDEPFSALDSHLRFQMERHIAQTLRDFGKSAVMVSHQREEAFRMAEDLAILHEGRVLQAGPKQRVLAAPACAEAGRLLGMENVANYVCAAEGRLFVPDWGISFAVPHAPGGAGQLGFFARDVKVLSERQGEKENVFSCTVQAAYRNPFSTLLALGDGRQPLWAQTESDPAPLPTARICVPPEKITLWKEP